MKRTGATWRWVLTLLLSAAALQITLSSPLPTALGAAAAGLASPTTTPAATPTATATATATALATATSTAVATLFPTATATTAVAPQAATPTPSPTATATAAATPTATATLTTTVTATATATSSLTTTVTLTPTITVTVDFGRRLSGERVGQHKVPPTSYVDMEVSAMADRALTSTLLADYFNSSWSVSEPKGGTVSFVDATTSKIQWPVGSLAAGERVSRTYTLLSPPLTSPPTKYDFWSELSYFGGLASSNLWEVIVSDPVPTGLNESHFRIGQDTPLTSMSWYAAADDMATGIPRNTSFRVRFQVYNGSTTGSLTFSPRLDWSSTWDGTYSAVPTTTTAGQPFVVTDTTQFANGATITTTVFAAGSITTTYTAVNGKAYDTQNPGASFVLTFTNYTEFEFNIKATTDATYGKEYYFRLTNNGTAFTSDATRAIVRIEVPLTSSDPHNNYSVTTDKCAACHRSHTGTGRVVRKTWGEEAVCLTCHDGSGSATRVGLQFNLSYAHPITTTTGVHGVGESLASSNFSGSKRHAECEDCHRPHAQTPGTHTLGSYTPSSVITGTRGISVTNTVSGTVPVSSTISAIEKEYQLCFTCHSSWAYGANPPQTPSGFWDSSGNVITATQTDQSVEFNTLNYAFHPVEGPGRNQPPWSANGNWPPNYRGLSNTFVSPWNANSTLYCSDCHGSDTATDPSGPHGSNTRWMLKKNEAGSGTAAVFCYNCHRRDVYGDSGYTSPARQAWSRFGHPLETQHTDATGNRWGIWCLSCHGGDGLGGIHGTNKGVGASGSTPLGKRFMNGAGIVGWTYGASEVTVWVSTTINPAVNLCTQTHTGDTGGTNYAYAP